MNISAILEQLNEENGSNYKKKVLKAHSTNELLKRVLKMTYDRATYDYGVANKTLEKLNPKYDITVDYKYGLYDILDILENEFCTRQVSGNAAIARLEEIFSNCATRDEILIRKIIQRDLKINMGRGHINNVFKGLIKKPVYMRCSSFDKNKVLKNIKFPAYNQLKADGTYREAYVKDGNVVFTSRSGEEYEYPLIAEEMSNYKNGYYFGELTVDGILDRSEGNGLINSDEPPHDRITFSVWDYVTDEDYVLASQKDKKNKAKIHYKERFEKLLSIIKNNNNRVQIIEYEIVNSLEEALETCSNWMNKGFEGSVLKSFNGVFVDSTPNYQYKIKLIIDAEVRIVGTKDGNKGTKREGKVGSIQFETDDGLVKGYASGFSDEFLDEISLNIDEYKGKVMTVRFNGVTKARGNDFYALMHPRYIEIRNDKNETDTIEKIFELVEMAKQLS